MLGTRFIDNDGTIKRICVREFNGYNWLPDWSMDFFEVGNLELVEFDDGTYAYKVDDLDYLIDYANDWAECKGDFCDEEIWLGRDRQVLIFDE